MRDLRAALRERINVRGLDVLHAVEANVAPAEVVREDEEEVRLALGGAERMQRYLRSWQRLRAAAEPIRIFAKKEAEAGQEVFRKVVNISSIAGKTAFATQADYCAAKAAVLGFTRGEVGAVLVGELVVLTLMALPIGLLIGSGLSRGVVLMINTETVRLPVVFTAAMLVGMAGVACATRGPVGPEGPWMPVAPVTTATFPVRSKGL